MTDHHHYTDFELLSLLRQDDEPAFLELYNRYAKKVRSLAYSKVNSVDIAREIVQNIFTDLWERRHSHSIESCWNYLAVAVKYQAINCLKKEINHKMHHHLYKAFVKISEEDTLEAVQFNELKAAVERGVKKLSSKTQLVFRLNRLEGKSVTEIASSLALSEKAIKYHLSKSLRELRLYLKDYLVSLIFLVLW